MRLVQVYRVQGQLAWLCVATTCRTLNTGSVGRRGYFLPGLGENAIDRS